MSVKFKATKKEMREGYTHIIGIGYCAAQTLLRYENAIAYSVRAEGWACDYYDIDGVLISTGYSPLACKNAKIDYSRLREFELKAQVKRGYQKTAKSRTRGLLRLFISECMNAQG